MPNLILNTCGTSLLTNLGIAPELRQLLNQSANVQRWDDISADAAATLKQHVAQRRQLLIDSDDTHAKKLSAELNGLLCWQSQPDWQPTASDMYLLLATDTALGMSTAEAICAWLQQKGYSAQVISAEGLNTGSLDSFRQALSSLVRQLDELLTGYKASGYHIQFNLTGGFKSLNGFLQALSTLYADHSFYLFEGSHEVIRIPTLPLTLDADRLILDHLSTFRRLSQSMPITAMQRQSIPELMLFHLGDEVMLSEWGELLWLSGHRSIYQQQILPSISQRVQYGVDFIASSEGRPSDLLYLINDRITMLAAYVEGDCKLMLKKLDAKPLQQAKYKADNIWECDLDGNHRIFMKKEGYHFTLHKVDKALH